MAREIDAFGLREIKRRLEKLLDYYRNVVGDDSAFVFELETRLEATCRKLGQQGTPLN